MWPGPSRKNWESNWISFRATLRNSASLLAGGDLPDIIYTNPAQQGVEANALITSGQLIPLDDLIEEYGENLKQNAVNRLEYSKQYLSNGEGKDLFHSGAGVQ